MARKVWQPIGAAMPAAAARRRIIRLASGWLIGLSESALPLWPRARTCDFLICRRCGVFIAAVSEMSSGTRAVVNVNCLNDRCRFTSVPVVHDF